VSGALARAFSTGAQLAMLVVFATGSYLALLQVSAVKELTTTTWGEALTVKLALWVTVLMSRHAERRDAGAADGGPRRPQPRTMVGQPEARLRDAARAGGRACPDRRGIGDGRVPAARGGRGRLQVRDHHGR
jgi:hypothetical protein